MCCSVTLLEVNLDKPRLVSQLIGNNWVSRVYSLEIWNN